MLRAYAVPTVREAEDRVRAGLVEGELMLRAAAGLAEVVAVRAEHRGARRIAVLAGPGDNGGDALHAAAMLVQRWSDGEPPRVDVVGIAPRLHPGGLDAALAAGIAVHQVDPEGELPGEVADLLAKADLVIDGLLGIGGRSGLQGAMARAVDQVAGTAYLVAVDLPSGTDPAGVAAPGNAVRADETVTFGLLKPVHLLPATRGTVGRLTLVDIGVETDAEPVAVSLEPADVAQLWPVPGPRDHKYSRGVLGVVAGSDDYPGAGVLCTTAAVEAGAGMVRYVGPRRAEDLVLAACPEVVLGEGRVQAYVVGPGAPDAAAVRRALGDGVPCVVDAGALEVLAALVRADGRRGVPTLLTPHAGELARLLGALEEAEVEREAVEADPVGHARRAAELTGCTVLLKGATTLVVGPEGAVVAQADAPPWLATAGAGDVLAGLAGVLLAGGLEPKEAGGLAALVHGAAADRANPGGPVRALAVARALPATVAELIRRGERGTSSLGRGSLRSGQHLEQLMVHEQ